MAPAVRLRAAVCLLGTYPALAGVDLSVEEGEVVLIRGPNGAGKTTLLRVLAGLLPLVEGECQVLGHDLRRDARAVRARVGLLGHATFLYDELTVAENARFWARAAKRSRADADEALDRLGVERRLRGVAVAKLSAGQRRRVAVAVVAARRPRLWLLDEPHAGLDAAARDLLDGLVRDAAAAGATVVLASHELDRAGALAGRAVTLAGGVVRHDGTAAPAPRAAEVVRAP